MPLPDAELAVSSVAGACLDPLTAAQLERIRGDADWLLEHRGVEVRQHPDTLARLGAAGARIEGTRAYFEPGLARSIVQASAPRRFVQRGRDPARDVTFGDGRTVTAPAAGPPMVRTATGVRRYATLADFEAFAHRVHAAAAIDHAGGMYCEPTDAGASVRHLWALGATLRATDKPLMGYGREPGHVTDSLDIVRAAFGEETFAHECCVLELLNMETPLVLADSTAEALARTARAGQGVLFSSFPVLGMTAPVTVAPALALALAEVQVGAALVQLVRPGAPVMVGISGAVFSMSAMRPVFGGSEALLLMSAGAQLARDLGCPVRGDGAVTSSKLADAQAGADAARGLAVAHASGVDFALHSAGWLESGLVMAAAKFDLDAAAIARIRDTDSPVPVDTPAPAPVPETATRLLEERIERRLREAGQ